MASIFQPVYTRTLPDGTKERRRSPTWWIEYTDPHQGRRVRHKGFKDRKATTILAADLERKAELAAVGAVDPFEAMRKLPIDRHIDAYEVHLQNKGVTLLHKKDVVRSIKAFVKSARVARLHELTPADIENFLSLLKERGRAARTRNMYLVALRSFYRWCMKTKRTPEDPTTPLSFTSEEDDVRRERWVLSPEDLGKLLVAAQARPLARMREYRNRSPLQPDEIALLEREGIEHALIYKAALLTGLRKSELAQTTWDDLQIDCDRPCLRVRAKVSKSRKETWLPVRKDLEQELLAWKEMNPNAKGNNPVFQVPKHMLKHLKLDLKFAGVDYEDESGRVADFHSLRKATSTYLQKGGVLPAVAQQFMRHSDIKLTLETYTDLKVLDKGTAPDALPALPPILAGGQLPGKEAARATGTDGKHSDSEAYCNTPYMSQEVRPQPYTPKILLPNPESALTQVIKVRVLAGQHWPLRGQCCGRCPAHGHGPRPPEGRPRGHRPGFLSGATAPRKNPFRFSVSGVI